MRDIIHVTHYTWDLLCDMFLATYNKIYMVTRFSFSPCLCAQCCVLHNIFFLFFHGKLLLACVALSFILKVMTIYKHTSICIYYTHNEVT